MKKPWIYFFTMILLTVAPTIFLTGCWDNHELDTLFIVTGVALDQADTPGEMNIALQIGKTESNTQGDGDNNTQASSTIMLTTTAKTVQEGMVSLNRNSSRTLFLEHNQVILVGSALAEQGVEDHLDLFLRNQEARMEVLFMVADGSAQEMLGAKINQEEISGMYLARVMQDMSAISPYYKIRMLDFVSRLRDGASSPVAPYLVLKEKEGQKEIAIDGLAVFKNDQMVAHLDNEETLGYIWAMGKVKQGGVVVQSDEGRAVFEISDLQTKRKVKVDENGKVSVALSVKADLVISELQGFRKMSATKLMPYLVKIAQNQIEKQITDTFETAKESDVDIYALGVSVYRRYPDEWEKMKSQWDELFPKTTLKVEAKVSLPSTGQIVKSLEMEGSEP